MRSHLFKTKLTRKPHQLKRLVIFISIITLFILYTTAPSNLRSVREYNWALNKPVLVTESASPHVEWWQACPSLGGGSFLWANESIIISYQYRDNGIFQLLRHNASFSLFSNITIPKDADDEIEGGYCDGESVYFCGWRSEVGSGALLAKYDLWGKPIWNYTWRLHPTIPGWIDRAKAVWSDGVSIYTAVQSDIAMTAPLVDLSVIKWNLDGSILWNGTWGSVGMDYVAGVAADTTGAYVWGMTDAHDGGWRDAQLVKWNANGTFAFNKTWGKYHYHDIATAIWINGSSIYTISHTDPVYNITVIKWDPKGNIIWTRTWAGLSGGRIWCDGARLHVIGNTEANRMRLCAWDDAGNQLWDVLSDTFSAYSIWGCGGAILTYGSLFSRWTWPSFTHPADVTYVHSTAGHNITWVITDASIAMTNYNIYLDGSLNATGTWVNGTLATIDIDGLAVGSHNYTIIAADGLGGINEDTVIVHVTNVPPSINKPSDVVYDHGTPGHIVSWNITDPSNGTTSYTIYHDGSQNATGTWKSKIPVNHSVDGLQVGVHNVTFIASDGLDGTIQDSVNVTVLNVPPSISNPANVTMVRGSINTNITWTITDRSTGTTSFTIYQNGTRPSSGTWINGSDAVVILDGLAMGSYNYTILANDGLGGIVWDEVVVSVLNAPPACSQPLNVTYAYAASCDNVAWTITDDDAATRSYTLLLDGIEVFSGTWASGTPVAWNASGLGIGSYNLSIVAIDGLGGLVQDEVNVLVVNGIPVISILADLAYVQGATGNQISWTIVDASTGSCSYTILRDGASEATGSWDSGTPVIMNVDGLVPGVYNFTIIVIDGLGGSSADTVLVTVKEGVLGIETSMFVLITAGAAGGIVVIGLLSRSSKQKRRRTPHSKVAKICPACGAPNTGAGDACKKCGKSLA